jgi:restriction system protein
MSRRRWRRRRERSIVDLAAGVTAIWLAMILWLSGVPQGRLWIFAGGVVVGMVWWWAIRSARQRRARGKRLEELQTLSPGEFEEWVGARFREQGYSVRMTGTHGTGGDHGIDLIVTKDGETAVVQCKKFREWTVSEPVVRDLYGTMTAEGASRAILVTTGRVTEPARAWARGKPIEIWDADAVARLSHGNESLTPAIAPALEVMTPVAADATVAPVCPRCGSALVDRRSRKTGTEFLGCSRFPACRHTQPVAAIV